jgi:hypothetical protein
MKKAKTKKPNAAGSEKKKKRGEKGQNKKAKKLRVLILEDNPADAELMEKTASLLFRNGLKIKATICRH